MFAHPFARVSTVIVAATCLLQAAVLPAAPATYNHDMSAYVTMTKATLKLVTDGDMSGAIKKGKELEEKWDSETTDLKKADASLWNLIDKQMDAAIAAVESKDAKKSTTELEALLKKYDRVPKAKN